MLAETPTRGLMKNQARFKQSDLTRIMKSAMQAGIPYFTITIETSGAITFAATPELEIRKNSMDEILWPERQR